MSEGLRMNSEPKFRDADEDEIQVVLLALFDHGDGGAAGAAAEKGG
jgi:hypothetical protein